MKATTTVTIDPEWVHIYILPQKKRVHIYICLYTDLYACMTLSILIGMFDCTEQVHVLANIATWHLKNIRPSASPWTWPFTWMSCTRWPTRPIHHAIASWGPKNMEIHSCTWFNGRSAEGIASQFHCPNHWANLT